jgi:hypothetical protein
VRYLAAHWLVLPKGLYLGYHCQCYPWLNQAFTCCLVRKASTFSSLKQIQKSGLLANTEEKKFSGTTNQCSTVGCVLCIDCDFRSGRVASFAGTFDLVIEKVELLWLCLKDLLKGFQRFVGSDHCLRLSDSLSAPRIACIFQRTFFTQRRKVSPFYLL